MPSNSSTQHVHNHVQILGLKWAEGVCSKGVYFQVWNNVNSQSTGYIILALKLLGGFFARRQYLSICGLYLKFNVALLRM